MKSILLRTAYRICFRRTSGTSSEYHRRNIYKILWSILCGAGGLDTDYVVHINNGTEDAKPIVLKLLPGEETIFELRLVNHGSPSNISIDASPPLIKAMRLKRANHYVELEEVIPVLARMPDNVERLDGEILVTSDNGTFRVPISLIGESNDWRDREDASETEDIDESDQNETDEENDLEGQSEDEDLQESSDTESSGSDAYKNYRTPPGRKSIAEDQIAPGRRVSQDYGASAAYDQARTWDDSGSRKGQDYNEAYSPQTDRGAPYYSGDSYGSPAQEVSYESSSDSEAEVETEDKLFGLDVVAEQILPIIMVLLIIIILTLTFYTATIPEFLGALTSSILIVTLIIYGAATLLKA